MRTTGASFNDGWDQNIEIGGRIAKRESGFGYTWAQLTVNDPIEDGVEDGVADTATGAAKSSD